MNSKILELSLFNQLLLCCFRIYRARAAWLLSKLSALKFRDEILQEIIRVLISAILNKDEEMPVKVEAAFAIESFLNDQHKSHGYIKPQVSFISIVPI